MWAGCTWFINALTVSMKFSYRLLCLPPPTSKVRRTGAGCILPFTPAQSPEGTLAGRVIKWVIPGGFLTSEGNYGRSFLPSDREMTYFSLLMDGWPNVVVVMLFFLFFFLSFLLLSLSFFSVFLSCSSSSWVHVFIGNENLGAQDKTLLNSVWDGLFLTLVSQITREFLYVQCKYAVTCLQTYKNTCAQVCCIISQKKYSIIIFCHIKLFTA